MSKWITERLPIHGSRIVDLEGRVIVANIYDDDIAAQIVREHNAHDALVGALNAAMHAMRSYYYGNSSRDLADETEHNAALALALAQKRKLDHAILR